MSLCTDNGLEWDIEALQLSYTLRALGWAKEHLPCFHSISCFVDGPAFWTLDRMCRLWNNEEAPPHSVSPTFNGAEEWPLNNHYDTHLYYEQLSLITHACTKLQSFDLTVSQDLQFQDTILKALTKLFCQSDRLQCLRLVFGDLAFSELDTGGDPSGRDHAASSKLFAGLGDISSWNELRDLELELVVDKTALVHFISLFTRTLRCLTFRRATLVNGRWESVLKRLASAMEQLDMLQTFMVCDNTPDMRIIVSLEDTLGRSKKILESERLHRSNATIINLDTAALYQKYRKEYKGRLT